MIWLLAALAIAATPDPRPPIAEALHRGDTATALAAARAALAADPAGSAALGLRFVEGVLLEAGGEAEPAAAAFAAARAETPALASWTDLRLAALAFERGETRAASSALIELLLAPQPPPAPLRREALALLGRAAARAGAAAR